MFQKKKRKVESTQEIFIEKHVESVINDRERIARKKKYWRAVEISKNVSVRDNLIMIWFNKKVYGILLGS